MTAIDNNQQACVTCNAHLYFSLLGPKLILKNQVNLFLILNQHKQVLSSLAESIFFFNFFFSIIIIFIFF